MAALVHVAGPVVAARQECSRCGHVLQDYSGHEVMVVAGDDRGLVFWAPGASVIVDGSAAFLVAGADDGHLNCKPVS